MVMECGRRSCDHIMCSHLVLDGEYYLCDPCFEELQEYRKTWPNTMVLADVRWKIEHFVKDTLPGSFVVVDVADIDAEFNRLTNS